MSKIQLIRNIFGLRAVNKKSFPLFCNISRLVIKPLI